MTPGAMLVRWVEDADVALDRPGGLTVLQLRALCARPESPGKIANGVTSYLQEQIRLMRQQDRDKRPDVTLVGTQELDRWQWARDRREERIAQYAAYHNEAMRQAEDFVRTESADRARLRRTPRRRAGEVQAEMVREALR